MDLNSLDHIIDEVFQRNTFLRIECFVTLMTKIICNIEKDPEDIKFRQIGVKTKIFEDQIASVKAAYEFLLEIGYVQNGEMMEFDLSVHSVDYLVNVKEMLNNALEQLIIIENDTKYDSSELKIISSIPNQNYKENRFAIDNQTGPSISVVSSLEIDNKQVSPLPWITFNKTPPPAPNNDNTENDVNSREIKLPCGELQLSQFPPYIYQKDKVNPDNALLPPPLSPQLSPKDQVDMLVEMGYSEIDSETALTISYSHLERAASILAKSRMNKDPSEYLSNEKKKMVDEEIATQLLIEEMKQTDVENEKRRKSVLEASDKMIAKVILREQSEAGYTLSLEQYGVLLCPESHKDGEPFRCDVCFDDYDLTHTAFLDCHHYLCLDDMRQYLKTQILSGRCTDIKCPNTSCDRFLEFPEVRRIIERKLFTQYQQFLCDACLKDDPNCRWCSKRGCGTPMIGNKYNPMMRCPNPECGYAFCFNCEDEWHADVTCENYQLWKKDNASSEDSFRNWSKNNTKKCPKCPAKIQKNGGCNHMKCTNCRYEFCWLCFCKYKAGHYSLDETIPCYDKQFT